MPLTRRSFLQQSGLLATAALLPQKTRPLPPPVRPVLDPGTLAAFVDPLPIPEVMRASELRPSLDDPKLKIPYYRLAMRPVQTKAHRDLKPTRCWGFGSSSPGPTIETESGQGMLVEWANELPQQHFLPIDHHLHGAESDKPDVRSVIHLHGAKVPPEGDGYPENWFVPGKSATYFYPNQQDAALLWYHDHTLGMNRLNVMAGLFGLCIIRDHAEAALHLPKGKYEVPLIFCDRMLDKDGQLYYPVSQFAGKPWIPEFFGNSILVNGKLLPFLEVEPRKYRFRVLNAANGRFFHLALSNDQNLHQIGTDQGLLAGPVALKQITLAPGERADVVVDFAESAGEQIVLKNDFAQPVMQFRVSRNKVSDESSMPGKLRSIHKLGEADAVKTRVLTLGEVDDQYQNPVTMLLNDTHWKMPVTENPLLNSTEIWELRNLTDDVHPIHLHLVRFQVLDRQCFDAYALQFHNVFRYRGEKIPPEPAEAGWKDTVRAEPGMITRIIVPFDGYAGRYVWHCHILEHEDNEMMRPYEVIAAADEATAMQSAPFTIRHATLEDIPGLRPLIADSVRILQASHYTREQREGALGSVFGVDSQLIRDGTYLLAEAGRVVVGCGGWSRRRTSFGSDQAADRDNALLDPARDAAKIRAFFVHPEWARRGIGSRILEACESAAAAEGFTRLELVSTLPGEPMYRACGFVPEEAFEVPLTNGVKLPVVKMTKTIMK